MVLSKKISIYLLIFAILVGTLVRTYKITALPFPPNGDELFFGYYGWSLLHFGTDEYGRSFPINFPSIGDFKYPGLAYLNIIPAAFFGLSEVTSRFWPVLSGIFLIPITFLFSLLIFDNFFLAAVSSWFVALSPWSITLSRVGYENHLAFVLTTSGILLLLILAKISYKKISFLNLKIENSNRTRSLILIISFILFLMSSFTYAAQRIFIPMMLLFLIVLTYIKNSELVYIRKHLYIFFVYLSLIIIISLIPSGNRGRASEEMWKGLTPQQTNRLEELKIEAGISPIKIPVKITQMFHNKVRITIVEFLNRYTSHFSPKFLFFEGEPSVERIPDMGVLLFIDILLLPIGLLTLFNKFSKKSIIIIPAWLIIAPIPSALTFGEPHINRASLMILPLALISSVGFWRTIDIFKEKVLLRYFLIILLSFLFLASALYALNQMFVQKPVHQAWIKEQINKQLVKDIFNLKDSYHTVVLPKDEFIFFLFYQKITPQDFLKRADIAPLVKNQPNWDRVNRLDNIYFKMPFDCPKSGKLHVLYICSGPNIPQNSKIIKVIRYLDKVPGYTFIEFYPISKMPSPLPDLPEGLKYMVDIEKSPTTKDGLIPDDQSRLW